MFVVPYFSSSMFGLNAAGIRQKRCARAISALFLLAAAAPVLGAPMLQLDKAVVLMRHGARSPNQTPEQLAKSSTRAWPEWPVAAGELTEHGAALVKILGSYYRQRYAADGLLPAQGCPAANSVAAWADNSAPRIPLSAQALLDGMFPGCALKAAYAPVAHFDPLFQSGDLGACPINARKARAVVIEAAGGDLDRAADAQHEALKRLQAILQVRSGVNCAGGAPSCGMDSLATVLGDSPEGPQLDGALKQATTVSENFVLEYVQGMPARDVAWGEAATPDALGALLGPRNLYLKLLRSPPYLASRNGTPLARQMLAALDGDDSVATPADTGTPPRASRFVAFVGRDIHLATLAGLLGVQWSLPGQPDNNPLDGTLAFERLRDPASGKRYVRTVIYYQTLEQMRNGTTFDLAHPPGRIVLKIPGCETGAVEGACPLPVLRARFTAAFAADCPRGASS